MNVPSIRSITATMTAALGAVLLTGCFMIPGKFDATLDLRSDGDFTYTYKGEIRFLGLTQLAEMADGPSYDPEWNPENEVCWGVEPKTTEDADEVATAAEAVRETSAEVDTPKAVEVSPSNGDRPCTQEELEERRKNFEDGQQRRKERKEREARQMQAMFGGIDPTDPEAGAKIAARLERQHGWNSVEYKGDGLFDVDFAITSRITHDFSFPMLEGMATAQPFLYAYRRDAGTVRVEAPGFARGAGERGATPASPYWYLMTGTLGNGGNSRDERFAEMFTSISGTFSITTDGEILANNTDEGYRDTANGRELVWVIDSIDDEAPTALIRLTR